MKPRSFLIFLLLAVCWNVLPASASRFGDIRMHARFLTDRMAYELRLTNRQYDDVFEINYDFFYNVEPYVRRMSYGDPYAVDAYYRYLDERNDDLRWVLSRRKYMRFMSMEHFYLPIYVVNHICHVRVYKVYPNRTHFYYARPHHYYSYHGGHCRHSHGGVSFYQTHYRKNYRHSIYKGHYQSIRSNTRHRDFPRLDNNGRPSRNENYRPNNRENSHAGREPIVRPLPSQRVEHATGIQSASPSRRPGRTETARPSHSTRPEMSARPSSSSRERGEYTRPSSSYRHTVKRTENTRESSSVRSDRGTRRRYESSSTRATRGESVNRRSSNHTSSRSTSSEHAGSSERRTVRER